MKVVWPCIRETVGLLISRSSKISRYLSGIPDASLNWCFCEDILLTTVRVESLKSKYLKAGLCKFLIPLKNKANTFWISWPLFWKTCLFDLGSKTYSSGLLVCSLSVESGTLNSLKLNLYFRRFLTLAATSEKIRMVCPRRLSTKSFGLGNLREDDLYSLPCFREYFGSL